MENMERRDGSVETVHVRTGLGNDDPWQWKQIQDILE